MFRVDRSKLVFFSCPSMIIARLSPIIFVSAPFTGAVFALCSSLQPASHTSTLHESTISRCSSCHFSDSAVRRPSARTTLNRKADAYP